MDRLNRVGTLGEHPRMVGTSNREIIWAVVRGMGIMGASKVVRSLLTIRTKTKETSNSNREI